MGKAVDNPSPKCEEKHLPMIASLLGCDCTKRMPKIGLSAVLQKTLPSVTEINVSNMTKEMRNICKTKISDDYEDRLSESMNLFMHANVSSYNNTLVPLNGEVDGELWGTAISFRSHPKKHTSSE